MPFTSSSSPTVPLPFDDIDELIYLTRANELADLTSAIDTLSTTHACSPRTILASAIDMDADGLGSQSSLLHYAAGNGHLGTMKYFLSLLDHGEATRDETLTQKSNGESTSTSASQPRDNDAPASTSSTQTHTQTRRLLNHQNVSGNTPLHWAAMNGHLDVVIALVRAGADARVRNAAGRDCIVEAEVSALNNGRSEVQAQIGECVVWMLKNCEGVEEGVGVGKNEVEEEESGQRNDMSTSAANGEGTSSGNDDGTTKVLDT
ncbi:hypothetical protein A1O7_04883 [Cladophialophora yegresii CBS 114405]|uniref:Ankyrin n=1 Tax=Cladophialophora yegresii CBS 114405 TaxID=1182544 RepID=W9W6V7_9EURO|nr:uncharacterized protein A1O7_04883 [Cladophialophora yegresii CBS 114405]EXJ60730.1 hypothetical protein A1O7_04883 [Cladophialophora yegresii CBS 114405]